MDLETDQTQGFQYLGHSNWTICSRLSWFCPKTFPLPDLYTLYPRELKMRRRESPKSGWHTGVSVSGRSNWTICSLLRWFCGKKFPSLYLSYWGLLFLITAERGRKETAGDENGKMGITQKWMTSKGFSMWSIRTGLFAACWTDFVPKFFHLFSQPPIINQFLLPQRGRSRGWKWEKETLPKWMRHRGFWPWGIQTGPFAVWWTDFVQKKFGLSTFLIEGSHFLLLQREREEGRREQGLKMVKKEWLKSE